LTEGCPVREGSHRPQGLEFGGRNHTGEQLLLRGKVHQTQWRKGLSCRGRWGNGAGEKCLFGRRNTLEGGHMGKRGSAKRRTVPPWGPASGTQVMVDLL